MRARNLIYTDLKRSIFSIRFLLSVLGITAMMFAAIGNMMSENSSIWYLMKLSIGGSGITNMTFCVLPVFAFGLSYAIENQTHAERYWIVRAGTGTYACSKVIGSAISGFLTVFLGMSLFVVILLPIWPFYGQPCTDYTYELLMREGKVLLGFLFYISHHSLSGAIMAVCAMWCSTLLPNRFVTTVAPMTLYFTILRFRNNNFPSLLDPIYWNSGIYDTETAGKTILIKIITSMILCMIMGIFIKINIDRRLLNE